MAGRYAHSYAIVTHAHRNDTINYAKERATLFNVGESMTFNLPFSARRFEMMEILRKGK